jgi:hypothetical protein
MHFLLGELCQQWNCIFIHNTNVLRIFVQIPPWNKPINWFCIHALQIKITIIYEFIVANKSSIVLEHFAGLRLFTRVSFCYNIYPLVITLSLVVPSCISKYLPIMPCLLPNCLSFKTALDISVQPSFHMCYWLWPTRSLCNFHHGW